MRELRRDQSGGVLAEVTVLLTILMMVVFGSVDALFAIYQWNAATKALELGARLASVSTPVSSDLRSLTGLDPASPGDQMPYFIRSCTSSGCSDGGTYSAAAMNTIVYGRGSSACGDATSLYFAGMCDIYWRIRPEHVVVNYEHTGLGYAGRPGGPVPTITLTLRNLDYEYVFLGKLLSFANPGIRPIVTIQGEDLHSCAPETTSC